MKKLKRTALFLICVVISLSSLTAITPVGAYTYDFPENALPVKITLDGKEALNGEAVLINSVTYVPLRSFSTLMGADTVSWNSRTSTATVKRGGVTIYVRSGEMYVEANGRYFYTVEKILNINGRLFVPIRAIAEPFSVLVDWNAKTRSVLLTSSEHPLVSGSEYYNSSDVYWLSRIISAEAAGESLEGQIAVGNVVLNRKRSSMYPNTVYGVIFDRRGGTQFSPVSMGTIYNEPSRKSIIAAKICLDGYCIDSGILFFMNPTIATSNWISKNRPFAFVIGNHHFYY